MMEKRLPLVGSLLGRSQLPARPVIIAPATATPTVRPELHVLEHPEPVDEVTCSDSRSWLAATFECLPALGDAVATLLGAGAHTGGLASSAPREQQHHRDS